MRYTVRVPMYAEAIFSEIEGDDEAAAIAEVMERINDNGILEAADYVEEHYVLGKKDEQLTEPLAELDDDEDDEIDE